MYETSYGADGKPSSIVAQGVRTDYTYDDAGRLKKLVSDNGLSVQYCYDRNGMQTQMLYGNGLIASYTYDSRSRLTGMQSCFKDRTPLFSASYTYDAAGNRTGRKENVLRNHGTQEASITTIYGYDSMNRLVAENCGDSRISYRYDLSGNRISQVTDGRTENYLYNSRNQLTELTGENKHIRYTYDPAGNLVEEHSADHKRIYAYDAYNRNIEIAGNDFTQKNHYDAEGYRYAIEENDNVTNFVYRGGIMLAELDEAKNPTKSYVPGNEYAGQSAVNPLNNSLTSENASASYYITDEQGSIRYILDQSGEVLNFYQYSAFGETIISEETTPNRLRYNAQTEDELTGLYYLRARYYAPNIGRFTQEDVIYNDGLNLYAYCDSNPVMYCDPSGFEGEPVKKCTIKVGGEKREDSEVYYRTMSQEDYDYLRITDELPPTGETFISPTKSFSSDYDGVMVEFNLNSGTISKLEAIGVSNGNRAPKIREIYPDMPYVSKGWTENNAQFKWETNRINIGLGKGKALEIFNSNISSYRKVNKE